MLATGAGERLEPAAPGGPYGVLVLPVDAALPTPAVFAEADRGTLRTARRARGGARAAAHRRRPAGGVENDLQPPARVLCPAIDGALADAAAAGADEILVSGSGPTVLGLFAGEGGAERARVAAAELAGRRPAAIAAEPVPAGWGAVDVVDVRHTAGDAR